MDSTPITITYDQLAETLRALANERPGYVYDNPMPDSGLSCLYVHPTADGQGAGGCIFGHALNRLGVPLQVLARHEGAAILGLLDDLAVDDVLYVGLNEEQRDAIDLVQGDQDASGPWAVAVERLDGVS